MKRLAFSILSSVVMASPAFAIVGGPWDNNMFFGRDINGSYQGVINGKNISGITFFGIASGSQVGQGSSSDVGIYGNAGRALIFVNGNLALCNVSSVANVPGRSLAISIDGSVGFGSTDSAQVTTVTTRSATTTTTGTDGSSSSTTTTTPVITTTTYVLDGASQISGIIEAGITRTFPQVEYTGKGTLQVLVATNLEQNPANTAPYVDVDSQNHTVRISGIRTSTSSPFIVGTIPWYSSSISTQTSTVVGTPTTTP